MNLGSIFVALSDVSFLIGTWYNFCYGKPTMRCDWALEMIISTGTLHLFAFLLNLEGRFEGLDGWTAEP